MIVAYEQTCYGQWLWKLTGGNSLVNPSKENYWTSTSLKIR